MKEKEGTGKKNITGIQRVGKKIIGRRKAKSEQRNCGERYPSTQNRKRKGSVAEGTGREYGRVSWSATQPLQ